MLRGLKSTSLTQQLALVLAVTLLCSVFVIASIQSQRIEDSNREVKLRELEGLSQAIGSSAFVHLSSDDFVSLETLLKNLHLFKDIQSVAIINEQNRIVSEVNRTGFGTMEQTFNIRSISPPVKASEHIQQLGQQIVYWHPFGSPVTTSGWVMLSVDTRFLEKIKSDNKRFIFIAGSMLFLATFFVLYIFLSRRVLAIQRLTRFAAELSSNVGQQIGVSQGALELNDMAKALNASSVKLEQQSGELERQKAELIESNAKLKGMITEINCIYAVSKILADPELENSSKIQSVVDLLPPSIPFLSQVHARIQLWGSEYVSDEFHREPNVLYSDVLVGDKKVGSIEIFYSEAASLNEAPVLSEQQNLVDEIGARLAIFYRNQESRLDLAQSKEELERQVAERTQDLERAMQQAREASKAKSEFLSRVSHELRTPMNAVMGFAQVLNEDKSQPLTEDQRESVGYILDAGSHLLELINEILDLTRIEHGSVKVLKAPVNLKKLVKSVVNILNSIAAAKSVVLQIEDEESFDLELKTDEGKLKQILINLISNAIKYNRIDGKVSIAARVSEGQVELAISDTGIGISQAHLKEIFEPFVQLNEISEEGTGIGLSVVKRLVELLGGQIEVESKSGQGSVFRFSLPL